MAFWGLFLTAVALFGFQVQAFAYLSFVLMGGLLEGVLALGFGGFAVGALLSGYGPTRRSGVLLPVSLPLSFALVRQLNEWNLRPLHNGVYTDIPKAAHYFESHQPLMVALAGLALVIPFALHGCLVTETFRRTPIGSRGRLFGAEMVGAALGLGLGATVLTLAEPYLLTVSATVLAALGGALLLSQKSQRWMTGSLALMAGAAVIALPHRFEPGAHGGWLAQALQSPARERVRRWTPHGRYSLLRWGDASLIALGNGEGHALLDHLYGFQHTSPRVKFVEPLAALTGTPKRALVLLAGAGVEVAALRRWYPDLQVEGVELSPTVRALAARAGRPQRIAPVEGIHLREARGFLEASSATYDRIFYSWNGSPPVAQPGGGGHTASYLFTREGLQAALRRLAPGGYLVLLGTQRGQLLPTLQTLAPIEGTLAQVFSDRDGGSAVIVRPQGFTSEERRRLRLHFAPWNARITFPETTSGPVYTDNRPFFFEHRRLPRTELLLALTALLAVLAVGCAWRTRGHGTAPALFFFSLGWGQCVLQAVLLRRAMAWLGSPTLALAWGLGAYFLGLAFTSWRSDHKNPSLKGAVALLLAVEALATWVGPTLWGLPPLTRQIAGLGWAFGLGALTGPFFPRGTRQFPPPLGPLLGLDTLGAALALLWFPSAAEAWGLGALAWAGLGAYAICTLALRSRAPTFCPESQPALV